MLVVIGVTCEQWRPFVYVCYAASMEVALTGDRISRLAARKPRPHATALRHDRSMPLLRTGLLKQEDLIMLGLITKVHNRVTDLKKFGKNESGATAIEYGLIAAGIAVAIIAAVFALGDEVKGFFEDI